jgi:serine/threonine-protein phosphatase 2A regulatory subunit B'
MLNAIFKQRSLFSYPCNILLHIKLVEGLLRYWTFGNSVKEVMFLTELVEVLEVCEITKLEPLIPKLFKRLIKCISGTHL